MAETYKTSVLLLSGLLLLFSGCNENKGKITENRAAEWEVIGPGGGGGVLKPTISPFNDQLILTHCDMTAMYITMNGGESWKMKNLFNVPDDFEFDPVDSNTIYIATRGYLHSEDRGSGISLLLRSEDRGAQWKIIYPDVSESKKVEYLQSTSLLPSDLIDEALDVTIQKVKVDPADNTRIYLGVAPMIDYMSGTNRPPEIADASLMISRDHGINWNVIATLPGKRVLGIFPEKGTGQVLVFTERACVSVNEATGEMRTMPLPVISIITVAGGTGKNGPVIYLHSNIKPDGKKIADGVFVSTDMGKNWTQSNNGLFEGIEEGRVPRTRQTLAVCESMPEVAYISVINPIINESGKNEEIYCIYKTVNTGKSWEPVLLSSTPGGYITKNFTGSWMEESFDPGWGGNPIDLAVAPGNPDVCFAGDNGRGYKTTDGGKTWIQVYSKNNPDGSYSNTGLNVTTSYGIRFDPFDKNHFFICYTDMGLFHTFDAGKSWFHSINGVPRNWQNTCYDLTFDPDVKGRVWSVWANAHDLPRTKMFSRSGFGRYSGGVAVSNDYGRTWEKSNLEMPENAVCTGIVLDPSSPAGSRTLYVTVMDRGIYKSVDDGKSWKLMNNGLGDNLFAWQVRISTKGVLYALFARGLRNGENVDGTAHFSDDNAESWNKLQLPDSVNGPHDLLINPSRPEIMYMSCWPRTIDGRDYSGGMIKSEDGGKSWKRIFDERVRVNAADMDPENNNLIYLNTFHNAAFRSEDSGNSWNRIEGYRFKWGQQVYADVNNPGMLFLTSYGGSVFYGPAKGVKGAKDDIVNMPEGWWPE